MMLVSRLVGTAIPKFLIPKVLVLRAAFPALENLRLHEFEEFSIPCSGQFIVGMKIYHPSRRLWLGKPQEIRLTYQIRPKYVPIPWILL